MNQSALPTISADVALAQLRIQLAYLQKKEMEVQEELHRVRVAIQSHKSRINHLIWTRAPINTLPFEILSYVLELTASSTEHDWTTSALAMVSRTWRHIIVDSPKFWNHIDLSPHRNVPFVKACVARSCQYPLHIVIKSWYMPAILSIYIDVILPHVHRWRTLEIRENRLQCFQLILNKINHLQFPSLVRTTIVPDFVPNMQYPPFLRPENSPSLKSLHLNNLVPMDGFPPGKRISDFSLQFSDNPFGWQILPSLLSSSSQDLTTLKLAYSACPPLQPSSIPLPFLTSLTLEGSHPNELLSAIVAPQLIHVYLTVTDDEDLSTVSNGLESKFHNTQHLGLHVKDPSISVVECASSISSVFPNVRHVELNTIDIDDFFRTDADASHPADKWGSLESLTFRGMKICCDPAQARYFVQWLRQRNLQGLPMLPVKFVDCTIQSIYDAGDDDDDENFWDDEDKPKYSAPGSLLYFHDLLRQICILNMVNVSLRAVAVISLTSAPPPPLVCIAVITELVTLPNTHD